MKQYKIWKKILCIIAEKKISQKIAKRHIEIIKAKLSLRGIEQTRKLLGMMTCRLHWSIG